MTTHPRRAPGVRLRSWPADTDLEVKRNAVMSLWAFAEDASPQVRTAMIRDHAFPREEIAQLLGRSVLPAECSRVLHVLDPSAPLVGELPLDSTQDLPPPHTLPPRDSRQPSGNSGSGSEQIPIDLAGLGPFQALHRCCGGHLPASAHLDHPDAMPSNAQASSMPFIGALPEAKLVAAMPMRWSSET